MMKTILIWGGLAALGAAGIWYWRKCQNDAAQAAVTASPNQAGGNSIFHEPDMEPQPSIEFA